MKFLQIVPREGERLYGAMVKKGGDLVRKRKGTFYRAGARARDRSKWRHRRYGGWVNIGRGLGELVIAEVHGKPNGAETDEWQLLSAFLGFLDRHFGEQIVAINIQYR